MQEKRENVFNDLNHEKYKELAEMRLSYSHHSGMIYTHNTTSSSSPALAHIFSDLGSAPTVAAGALPKSVDCSVVLCFRTPFQVS